MVLELLAEYWRVAVVGGTGLLVLALRRRVPRWVQASWALLTAAVVLAWLVDMSWVGTLVIFVGLSLIASAFWLRAEERLSAGAGPSSGATTSP
jgi:hypothetical protein